MRSTWVPMTMLLAGCGGAPAVPARAVTTSAPPSAAAPETLAPPQIELGAPNHATAFGEGVAFDGVAEGLYWPALAHAFASRGESKSESKGESKGGGATRVVLAAPRDARVLDVLRAVWTLREADVEVQTLGPGNEVRPLVLAKRPATRPDGPTCHAAVFVGPESSLRVALPGGSVAVHDVAELVASLGAGARSCTVRWVAVGAESPSAAWGGVFDVAYTVQASQVAGKARVVLGEPVASKP
jgi:hypothetical protein